MREDEGFMEEVKNLSKYFNAPIFNENGKWDPEPETQNELDAPPPLPADGKWCILRTPENAEMVNGYINKNIIHDPKRQLKHDYGYITSDGCFGDSSWADSENPHMRYPEITDEQFRVHVLGEKGVDFDHTIDLSHASPFVKSGANPAHDINTYPKEFKDAAENMRNEAAKTLLEDQPQHDQWEYATSHLSNLDSLKHMNEMGKEGWEAFSSCFSHDDTMTLVHFKRRKK